MKIFQFENEVNKILNSIRKSRKKSKNIDILLSDLDKFLNEAKIALGEKIFNEKLTQIFVQKVSEMKKEEAEIILKHNVDVNARNVYGNTPLMLSTEYEVSNLLIQKKSKVNDKDGYGWDALRFAVFNNKIDIAELLLDNGADINTQNIHGESLLDVAIYWRNKEMVKFLVERKIKIADVGLRRRGITKKDQQIQDILKNSKNQQDLEK